MSEIPSKPITRKEAYLAAAAGQSVEMPAKPITREEAYLEAIAKKPSGGGGTSDYSQLTNKPQIGDVTLQGNKSASDLGLVASVEGKGLSTNDYTDADKAIVDGVPTELTGKQDKLTADRNINILNNVIKAGVFTEAEVSMNIFDYSTASGTKTYTILEHGLYEIFYCMTLQSTVSVSLPNNANVLFERDMYISSHPVKHMIVELQANSTVTITQTPNQWQSVVSGILKLDAINVVGITDSTCIADSTATYKLPNDNKYYLVVGACVGKPTGNNAVDGTSGGTPEITKTLTGSGVRFRSVVVKGSESPNFSFYGYDGGVASVIAFEIEFEEGNWDYNLATKFNYSTTEVNTGQKWIDGKDIYCKVYDNVQLSNGTDVTVDANFGADKTLIKFDGVGFYTENETLNAVPLGNYLAGSDKAYPKVEGDKLIIVVRDNWSVWNCHFIVYYTKET